MDEVGADDFGSPGDSGSAPIATLDEGAHADVEVPIPDVPDINDQVYLLPGMPDFDEFDDEDVYDEDDDWDDVASVAWEVIPDDFDADFLVHSEGDYDETDYSSYEEPTEGGIPKFELPYYLSPEDYSRHNAPSSSSHRQVCDSVCCDGGRDIPGAHELLMVHEHSVQIRSIPQHEQDGVSTLFEASMSPIFGGWLGDYHPFSIARTDDGRFLAVASGTGYVFLIEVGPGDKKEAQDTCSSAEDDGEDQHNRSYVRYRSFVFALSDQGEMANSVRFGRVGGKTRLMVGSQGKYVVFFELPNENGDIPTVAALCPSQEGDPTQNNSIEFESKEIAHIREDSGALVRMESAAIGSFPAAVNFVISSANGRWLAVCGDYDHVVLLDEQKRYRLSARKELKNSPSQDTNYYGTGSHYCSFNPSGDIVVATSDQVFGAFAWSTERGELLFHCSTRKPCLPVKFLDDFVFSFAESAKRLHIVDVRYHTTAHQVVTVPSLIDPTSGSSALEEMDINSQHITGLDVKDDKVFLATKAHLFSFTYFARNAWSRESHKLYPIGFQRAVRTLLLCACSSLNSGLHKLDSGAMENIISRAAHPLGQWTSNRLCKQNVEDKLADVVLSP